MLRALILLKPQICVTTWRCDALPLRCTGGAMHLHFAAPQQAAHQHGRGADHIDIGVVACGREVVHVAWRGMCLPRLNVEVRDQQRLALRL